MGDVGNGSVGWWCTPWLHGPLRGAAGASWLGGRTKNVCAWTNGSLPYRLTPGGSGAHAGAATYSPTHPHAPTSLHTPIDTNTRKHAHQHTRTCTPTVSHTRKHTHPLTQPQTHTRTHTCTENLERMMVSHTRRCSRGNPPPGVLLCRGTGRWVSSTHGGGFGFCSCRRARARLRRGGDVQGGW